MVLMLSISIRTWLTLDDVTVTHKMIDFLKCFCDFVSALSKLSLANLWSSQSPADGHRTTLTRNMLFTDLCGQCVNPNITSRSGSAQKK